MRSTVLASAAVAVVVGALVLRATTVHSLDPVPSIYRVRVNVNDLDGVEGLAPPGRLVELWARQRNFIEGQPGTADAFEWCGWRSGGRAVRVAVTRADASGVWRLTGLRQQGTTITLMPPAPGGDRCLGGLYTELLPRACDDARIACTAWQTPTMHWLNLQKLTPIVAATTGSVSDAHQAAIAVADGPDQSDTASDLNDVDENGLDLANTPGYVAGQRVTWRCGAGGTAACPSVTVHDPSTATTPDPEYPFVLGTMQAHRPGGSFIAAAAIRRGQPIGFAVNVNVNFRGRLDVNLGCDQKKFFTFSRTQSLL